MSNLFEDNLREQNKILKDALLCCYKYKLNRKTKIEVIEKTLNEVMNLERKLKIKLVKNDNITNVSEKKEV